MTRSLSMKLPSQKFIWVIQDWDHTSFLFNPSANTSLPVPGIGEV